MKLLLSSKATLTVLCIALVAQIPHAAYVFTHIGDQKEGWFNFFHGYSYAIALELAVLLFVVRNRQAESYGFAAVSIAINLCYYAMHNVTPFQLQAFPAWLVSVALPVAIACYSHDIAHETVAPVLRTIDVNVAQPAQQITQQNETVVVPVAQQKPTSAQRRAQLETWLRNNITINVSEVAEGFGVSQQLVRRELKELRS